MDKRTREHRAFNISLAELPLTVVILMSLFFVQAIISNRGQDNSILTFANLQQQANAARAAQKHAEDKLVGIQKKLLETRKQLDEERGKRNEISEQETLVRKELIGLKGSLRNVVIVFDRSGSMSEAGRWDHARNVVHTWLQNLAIHQCALILFSTSVDVFPKNGEFLDLNGPIAEENRALLLRELEQTQPGGRTDTLKALVRAYQYPGVDTILLFTDGEPNLTNSRSFDRSMATAIYDFCEAEKTRGREVTVNTIGLGDYFRSELGDFLMNISQITGGTFLGR